MMKRKATEYYDVGGIPTIDYIRAKLSDAEFRGFCLGNVLKYSSRAGIKEGSTVVSDYEKANYYLVLLKTLDSKPDERFISRK